MGAFLAVLMKKGDVITAQLVDHRDAPIHLSGVEVTLSLFMRGQHRYSFGFGPTNEQGRLTITYDDVERERRASLAQQPWDYKTLLEECDPRVTLSVRSGDELAKAIDTARDWNAGVLPTELAWWTASQNGRIQCAAVDVDVLDGAIDVAIACECI